MNRGDQSRAAPAWTTTQWLNSDPIALTDLRGQVVVIEAFQMLCPGCVSGALPQAERLQAVFADQVAVIGLHTVFEHHAAMSPAALEVFALEYALTFPIGVDAHDAALRPVTFTAYAMRGTPTTALIDRDGRLRAQHFGAVDDMRLAAEVTALLTEPFVPVAAAAGQTAGAARDAGPVCAVADRCS